MTHKFRWPPSAAIQELIERGDEIDSLYIAVQYRNGQTGVIASGMSETSAMRVALKFLLDGGAMKSEEKVLKNGDANPA